MFNAPETSNESESEQGDLLVKNFLESLVCPKLLQCHDSKLNSIQKLKTDSQNHETTQSNQESQKSIVGVIQSCQWEVPVDWYLSPSSRPIARILRLKQVLYMLHRPRFSIASVPSIIFFFFGTKKNSDLTMVKAAIRLVQKFGSATFPWPRCTRDRDNGKKKFWPIDHCLDHRINRFPNSTSTFFSLLSFLQLLLQPPN